MPLMRARRRCRLENEPGDATVHDHAGGQVFVKLAATLLAVAAASVALLPVLLLDGGRREAAPQAASWAMPPLAAKTVGGGTWTRQTDARPAAFIYVDRECLHCKAEMERWERLAAELDFADRVWVVASPGSEMDEARWVPSSLRGRTLHDVDGSMRAQLGVHAVPTTFWVDGADTVRIVQVGQSSSQVLIDNILTVTTSSEQVNE